VSLLEENQSTDLEKIVGLSRRGFISAGALCGAAMFLGGNLLSRSALAAGVSAGNSRLLGFESIPAATTDVISLPKGYKSSVLISWGQPLHKNGPTFDPSGNGTAAAQEVQFGDNNDGMSLFEFPDDRNRALMAINNEYTNYRYLYPHGGMPQSAEDVRKALACEGVSVIEVQRRNGQWQFVQGSRYNRRIHGNSPLRISGPAAGHELMKTAADKHGKKVLGTFQNCANGKTPWGHLSDLRRELHRLLRQQQRPAAVRPGAEALRRVGRQPRNQLAPVRPAFRHGQEPQRTQPSRLGGRDRSVRSAIDPGQTHRAGSLQA
jgi:hypothetical protein